MNDERGNLLAGPFIMLLSAAVFAYFGFLAGIVWNSPGLQGQVILFRIMLGWTLKVTAITFAASAGLTFVHQLAGNALYGVVGLLSALMFVIIAVLDVADSSHTSFTHAPIILILFAAWNGYSSWAGLRAVLFIRRLENRQDPSFGPS